MKKKKVLTIQDYDPSFEKDFLLKIDEKVVDCGDPDTSAGLWEETFVQYVHALFEVYLINEKKYEENEADKIVGEIANNYLVNIGFDLVNDEKLINYLENEIIKMKYDVTTFIKTFKDWKNKVDKIMKENNFDELTAEHEFYDKLLGLYYGIEEGLKIDEMIGTAEMYENDDSIVITYDYIDNMINAMNDCWYVSFEENGKTFMYIDGNALNNEKMIKIS